METNEELTLPEWLEYVEGHLFRRTHRSDLEITNDLLLDYAEGKSANDAVTEILDSHGMFSDSDWE